MAADGRHATSAGKSCNPGKRHGGTPRTHWARGDLAASGDPRPASMTGGRPRQRAAVAATARDGNWTRTLAPLVLRSNDRDLAIAPARAFRSM